MYSKTLSATSESKMVSESPLINFSGSTTPLMLIFLAKEGVGENDIFFETQQKKAYIQKGKKAEI